MTIACAVGSAEGAGEMVVDLVEQNGAMEMIVISRCGGGGGDLVGKFSCRGLLRPATLCMDSSEVIADEIGSYGADESEESIGVSRLKSLKKTEVICA